jgi:hypothetical protein
MQTAKSRMRFACNPLEEYGIVSTLIALQEAPHARSWASSAQMSGLVDGSMATTSQRANDQRCPYRRRSQRITPGGERTYLAVVAAQGSEA